MKQKQWLLIAVFFAILFMLPISFLLNQKFSIDASEASYLQENRTLEALPTVEQSISEWPTQIENFCKDHLPFRGTLTLLNATINYTLFNTTTSDQVLLGSDRWMFLRDLGEVTNIADYQGVLTLSDEECAAYYQNLNTFAQTQSEQGRQTVLFIVPNKEQVYSQYLPDGIEQINEISRTDTLINYIAAQESTLLLADPKPALTTLAQTDDGLYYKYDTHWTPAGCYVGLQSLLDTLGVETTPYDAADFVFEGEYFSGDLGALAGLYLLEKEPVYSRTFEQEITATVRTAEYCASLEIYESNAENTQRVLVLGDSFRYEMENQLSNYYAQVGYLDITLATQEIIDAFDPDIVVIEQVERNITQLALPIL